MARAQRVGTVKVALEGQAGRRVPVDRAGRGAARQLLRPRVGHGTPVVQEKLACACATGDIARTSMRTGPDRLPQRRIRPRSPTRSVSVLDRGFIYGDGVYEVVPIYGARAVPAAAAPRALAAQPRRHRPRQPAHRRAVGSADPRPRRAPAVRRPGRLPAGHARRGQARSRVSAGRRTDGVHDEQSAAACRRASRSSDGVAVVTADDNRWQRCDLKTTSLLGNVLMRQLAADARCRRNGDVPRRLPDRGVGLERADRQRRHDHRAAEGQPHPAGHHLRRDARSSRATPACRSTCVR